VWSINAGQTVTPTATSDPTSKSLDLLRNNDRVVLPNLFSLHGLIVKAAVVVIDVSMFAAE